jgi:hypothetical protein
VTDLARLLLHVLTLAAGLAIGWHARGWHDGSTISASDASASAQDAVTVGAGETVRIVDASRQTADAAERVRYITRTVEVAPECPPGRGAVSAGLADELREAIK